MDTIDILKNIIIDKKHTDNGGKTGLFLGRNDFLALEEAIKALENQSKYEKALQMACESLKENDICPVKCCNEAEPYGESYEPRCYGDCCAAERFADYFKKQAGLEVSP